MKSSALVLLALLGDANMIKIDSKQKSEVQLQAHQQVKLNEAQQLSVKATSVYHDGNSNEKYNECNSYSGANRPASNDLFGVTNPGSSVSNFDYDTWLWTNCARTDPEKWIKPLVDARIDNWWNHPSYPNGIYQDEDGNWWLANEGQSVYNGTPGGEQGLYADLEDINQGDLEPLAWSDGLSSACEVLQESQSATGQTGHDGPVTADFPNGMKFWDRIELYGTWSSSISENISYSMSSGKAAVMQLIVDDGVASRGHRTNLFNSNMKFLGCFGGHHGSVHNNKMMCQDFAVGFTANSS